MKYLKIKDNVDLKELEKFRFNYTSGEDWHIFYDNVSVSLGDGREIVIDFNDMDYDEQEIMQVIFLIYDLIKADLIEVVENDN